MLAERLASRSEVAHVLYPGLADSADIVRRQMKGPGTVLAFTMRAGYGGAAAVLRSLRLVTPAVSLGCNDTLIEHPAGLTHRALSEEARAASGITAGLLRLSVGIENVEDLWEDLSRALVAGGRSSDEGEAREERALAFSG